MNTMDFHQVKEFSIITNHDTPEENFVSILVRTNRGDTQINLHTNNTEEFEIKWKTS